MGLNTVQSFIRKELDGLAAPELPNAQAYVAPPVIADLTTPAIFIWGGRLMERRKTMAGGRADHIGLTSGFRNLEWKVDIYLKVILQNSDPVEQSKFPTFVDAVMIKLRGIKLNQKVVDPITGDPSTITHIGEDFDMTYGNIHATADERLWIYECHLTTTVREYIQQ